MNLSHSIAALGALLVSTPSFAYDCRTIFEPGLSEQVQALIGKKFELVDEEKVEDVRKIPFRITVKEDVDFDLETLTLKLIFHGTTMIESKYESEGFHENVAKTEKWLKGLPSCAELYRPHPSRW